MLVVLSPLCCLALLLSFLLLFFHGPWPGLQETWAAVCGVSLRPSCPALFPQTHPGTVCLPRTRLPSTPKALSPSPQTPTPSMASSPLRAHPLLHTPWGQWGWQGERSAAREVKVTSYEVIEQSALFLRLESLQELCSHGSTWLTVPAFPFSAFCLRLCCREVAGLANTESGPVQDESLPWT